MNGEAAIAAGAAEIESRALAAGAPKAPCGAATGRAKWTAAQAAVFFVGLEASLKRGSVCIMEFEARGAKEK